MNADTGRRTFVRHVTVGLPLMIGSAAIPAAASAGGAPLGALTHGVADEGMNQVLRRLAALHNDVQRRLPTVADARALGAELRALIAYRQQSNREAEVTRAWRELVARHGAGRLGTMQPDVTVAARALAHYGVVREPLIVNVPTEARRVELLDEIGRRGVNAYMDEVDALLSALGIAGDPVACQSIREAMNMVEAMVGIMCLLAPFIPLLIPECFAASTVLAILQMISLLLQC